MTRHDAWRNGRLHVRATRCPTCIFRPGNPMHLARGRVREMVNTATRNDSAIICHATLDGPNAVCRGFHDAHPTTPLQIAGRLGLIEWQP